MLTGEAVPAEKSSRAGRPRTRRWATAPAWRSRARLATSGQGAGVVVATGAGTEIGKISALLGEVEPELTTPLLRQMTVFARR